MRTAFAVVRNREVSPVEGHDGPMNAASLVKQVIAHLALELLDDLDQPVHDDITVRHVLTHTTGLPNWRPEGAALAPLRPPGTRWGYSGEGFVLLQAHLEQRTGRPIDHLAREHVFEPLGMHHNSGVSTPMPAPSSSAAPRPATASSSSPTARRATTPTARSSNASCRATIRRSGSSTTRPGSSCSPDAGGGRQRRS